MSVFSLADVVSVSSPRVCGGNVAVFGRSRGGFSRWFSANRRDGRLSRPAKSALEEQAHVEPIRVSVLADDLVMPLVAAKDQALTLDLRLEFRVEEIRFVGHAGNQEWT